ncbi:MAG: hypothetical protein ACOCYV_02255, partial [Planctomycetota bacterium]
LEDKIVQQALVWILECIYEEDFTLVTTEAPVERDERQRGSWGARESARGQRPLPRNFSRHHACSTHSRSESRHCSQGRW